MSLKNTKKGEKNSTLVDGGFQEKNMPLVSIQIISQKSHISNNKLNTPFVTSPKYIISKPFLDTIAPALTIYSDVVQLIYSTSRVR